MRRGEWGMHDHTNARKDGRDATMEPRPKCVARRRRQLRRMGAPRVKACTILAELGSDRMMRKRMAVAGEVHERARRSASASLPVLLSRGRSTPKSGEGKSRESLVLEDRELGGEERRDEMTARCVASLKIVVACSFGADSSVSRRKGTLL